MNFTASALPTSPYARRQLHLVCVVCLMSVVSVSALAIDVQVVDSKPTETEAAAVSFVDAAQQQRWDAVRRMLDQGVDVDSEHPDGMTSLLWACHHQNEAAVKQLIIAGADVQATNAYGQSPLAIAAAAGNAKIVTHLLAANSDPNQTIPGEVTPMHLAAAADAPGTIVALVNAGAEIDTGERSGQTPAMWAAAKGSVRALDALITAGADTNLSTDQSFTPMMFAARNGRSKCVRRLLDAGVDVNAAMKPKRGGARAPRKGTTALILAVESGHFELAMDLVAAGADPNDQRCGFTPLHIVSWVRKPNRGENPQGDPSPRGSGLISSLEFVRKIVDAGADVNRRIEGGKGGRAVLHTGGATPFLLASRTADLELMELLLELGADPMITNVDDCNAVMAAAGVGVRSVGEEAGTEPEVVAAIEKLVSLGVPVNAIDKNKETAMHGAAYRNFPKVVEVLARHGARGEFWMHKNDNGWTPIRIAEGYRPGSFKPSPETVAALQAALKNHP